MKHPKTAVVTAVIGLMLPGAARAKTPDAFAQLPLDELLSLHQRMEALEAKAASPIDRRGAVLDRIEGTGRVTPDALEVAVRLEVVVDTGSAASARLPLLRLSPEVAIVELPRLEGVVFAVREGWLVLETSAPGRKVFELGLLRRGRRATIRFTNAALARLELVHDTRDVAVIAARLQVREGRRFLYADDGTFELSWRPLRSVEEPDRADRSGDPARSTLEPIVERAFARTVFTLEGQSLTRVQYRLRVARRTKIGFVTAPGQTVRRVSMNGKPVDFEASEGRVELVVEADRPGGEASEIVLALDDDKHPFRLSGEIGVHIPRATWPTREAYFAVQAPRVFTYEWSGGTLVPSDHRLTLPDVDLPDTGARVQLFHCLLVGDSGADVRLRYLVDLEGAYYAGRGDR